MNKIEQFTKPSPCKIARERSKATWFLYTDAAGAQPRGSGTTGNEHKIKMADRITQIQDALNQVFAYFVLILYRICIDLKQ